jgi:hypothetical protein
MEREWDMETAGEQGLHEDEPLRGGREAGTAGRPGPTWRAWVISILAAVILSVAATLLLGGSFAFRKAAALPAGVCGAGGACCPPAHTAAGK